MILGGRGLVNLAGTVANDRLIGVTPSRLLSVILPFAAGVSVVAAIAVAVILLSGNDGGGDGVANSPTPTSGNEGTPTPTPGPYPVLADGEYIDSLPSDIPTVESGLGAVPLTRGASGAGGIAVVEITGIVETIVPTPEPGTVTPSVGNTRATPWTVYIARVQQWIKGGQGETEIKISEIGGVDYDGARLYTGTFLAQVGRVYLVSLDAPIPTSPGKPDYIGALTGWSNFEIGGGAIHVLNENNSRRLMGAYNLTPVEDFIAMVREWIVAPPAVTPTSPPSPTASP